MPEERKLVTVLFADIVGSTALGEEHDPEVVRETLARTFDALRQVLEAHGGTVEKFIGDAVMAVFGVPSAHDDDADRAVRAAFAARETVARLNADSQLAVSVRVGVNSGQAVTGSGGSQFLVTGGAVNAGSRLQSAASPGEILVGALTRQLTQGGVRYGPSRTIEAKGIGRLEAWPALELVTAVPEQHRGFVELHAPLIGRDRELRVLEEVFARVRDEGAPAVVALYGPAGSGKSRLTSEFVRRIGHERVRAGRCLPYGEGITFYPVQIIVRAESGIELTDDHAAAIEKLGQAVSEVFEAEDEARAVAARVATVAGLARAQEALPHVAESDLAEELRWGVRRFFERRAARAPLVLVFEDLQWAEPALVELVEHLAEWSRAPLFLLCLARPDFRDAQPTFGASAANATTITLGPLPPDDTRRLIAELLSLDALPESLRTEVVSRAEGNPLYVEEFLRMLIETARIERRDGTWVGVGDLAALEVPPTLQGLITARLDRVAPEVKRFLQNASLVGRLFSTSGLEAIGGEPVQLELLREAVRRDLLVEADERAVGAGRVYRFKHVLIRDVAYSTVPKAERVRMHDNYARWLEASLGDRAEEFSDLIAYHAEQAFLLAKELGRPNVNELGARALERLLTAATRARLRQDLVAGTKLYVRAAAVADAFAADPRRRAEARGFATAGRYQQSPRTPELDAELDAAVALSEQARASEALMWLYGAQGFRASTDDQFDAARSAWSRMVDVARATGDVEVIANAMTVRAFGSYLIGDDEQYPVLLTEARDYYLRSGARRGLPFCLQRLALVAMYRGDFAAAARHVDEAEAAMPPERSRLMEAHVAGRRGLLLRWVGDLTEARRLISASVSAAREAGDPFAIALALWGLGEVNLELGEFAVARTALEEAAALFASKRARGQLPEVHARAARACIHLADLAAARAHVDAAQEALLRKDVESAQITAVARAELAEALGDVAEADRVFPDTIKMVAPSMFANKVAETRVAYAEFLIRQGRFGEARRELAAARDFYRDPLAYRRVEQIDALLAKCEVPAS